MRRATIATVLLVEDNPGLREVLTAALDAWGYHVLAAEDGRQGLSMINNQAQRIDVLLSDITLPFVSGLKLSKVLKGQRPATKCLMMSGYDRPLLRAGEISPTYRFIQKPFRLQELRALIEKMLSESERKM